MGKAILDEIWAGAFVLVALFLLLASRTISYSAEYPRLLLVGILIMAVLVGILGRQKRLNRIRVATEQSGLTEGGRKFGLNLAILAIVPFVCLALWPMVGFALSTIGFLTLLFLYKRQHVVKALVVAIAVTVVVQFVFGSMFQVPLPRSGLVPWF